MDPLGHPVPICISWEGAPFGFKLTLFYLGPGRLGKIPWGSECIHDTIFWKIFEQDLPWHLWSLRDRAAHRSEVESEEFSDVGT